MFREDGMWKKMTTLLAKPYALSSVNFLLFWLFDPNSLDGVWSKDLNADIYLFNSLISYKCVLLMMRRRQGNQLCSSTTVDKVLRIERGSKFTSLPAQSLAAISTNRALQDPNIQASYKVGAVSLRSGSRRTRLEGEKKTWVAKGLKHEALTFLEPLDLEMKY